MFVWLAHILAKTCPAWGLLDSLSLRCLLAALTALVIAILFGNPMIRYLQKMQIGQVVREEGPQSHFSKKGTPTMGGVLTLIALSIAVLLWSDLSVVYVWITLLVTLGFGVIGWMDDYYKKALKHSRGLRSRWKYFWQSVIGFCAAVVLYYLLKGDMATAVIIPWMKNCHIELGLGLIILGYFVIVGSSNAVNLTDGLDGLAIFPIMLVAGGLLAFAYVSGSKEFSQTLMLPYVPGSGELAVFCSAIIGAGLGFLWFNAYPALVFMGDVGALSLGAALGVIAIIVRQELLLAIMGLVFVIEAISVMLQVGSYRLRNKKRIFRMAPLHHHFELGGMPESRVTVRFWIVTVVLVVIGLTSLKLP